MDSEESDIRLIDDYLDKSLTDGEMLEVEERLEKETDFKELMNDIRFFRENAEFAFQGEIKEFLAVKDASMDPFKENTGKVIEISYRRWYYAAAAIALLAALSYLLFQTPGRTSEELFQAYYEPYPNLLDSQQRGETYEEMGNLEQAMAEYSMGNFEEAAIRFSALSSEDKEGLVLLYEGISYLETGEADKAIQSFEKAGELDAVLQWQSIWYTGLVYLKTNNIDNTKEIFGKLAERENPYQNRAREIMKEL